MNISSAYNVTERHLVLVANIGTFAEEDEAYELLNNLRMSLPFIVMITSFFDALLAAVYLKCLHPWKILLQEVSSFSFSFLSFTIAASQVPDLWEFEDDSGAEQANEVELSFISHLSDDFFLAANPGGKGCISSCHFSWTGENKRSTSTLKKPHQDSPLLGVRSVVGVELHSAGASLTQVDIHIPIVLSHFNQTFVSIFR